MNKCGVCLYPLSDTNQVVGREMINGDGGSFQYLMCGACRCLQLINIPPNLNSYYKVYYGRNHLNQKSLKFRLTKLQFQHVVGYSTSLLGKLASFLMPDTSNEDYLKFFDKNSKVIDVGAASGERLLLMQSIGFQNVYGVDPLITESIVYANGLKVEKKTISDISEKFDVVMAHHVLEHVADQLDFMSQLSTLLREDGLLIIRIPTVSSYEFEHFGSNWFELDAPRHLFLHSRESIIKLLSIAGFEIIKIYDDSHALSIISSQLYEKNIPFKKHRNWYFRNLPKLLFLGHLVKAKKTASSLNHEGRGSRICVVARKLA